ncbi:nitroreductase/quinone reductase family protein [Nocardia veterana]|uniref:Nitroreductase family deazaflavin-dependent oxidoreductase n=1 Tax=Nocardia veterana TaxID=132249 RepID=A0A7X6RJZ1_9NOCA|nr:nitroreductase/quinone reductase family protein [Nocardia veterana]NKY88099.1 nitroreductase family deazaflavin-dependent oxidoreductase [Nocardia veterana]
MSGPGTPESAPVGAPAAAPPGRGRLRTQTAVDAVLRTLLRSPLHRLLSGKLLIITVIGRKTGRVYAHPVGYAESDGALLIGTAAAWRRNLRPGEPVRVTWRGRERLADWELITGEHDIAEPYRIILAHNPTHGRFAGITLDADGNVDRDQLRAALDRGTVVVRLRPRSIR